MLYAFSLYALGPPVIRTQQPISIVIILRAPQLVLLVLFMLMLMLMLFLRRS